MRECHRVLGIESVFIEEPFLDFDLESPAPFTRRALNYGSESTIFMKARGEQTRDDARAGLGGAAELHATDVTATWHTRSWRRVRLVREMSLPQTRGTNQAQDSMRTEPLFNPRPRPILRPK